MRRAYLAGVFVFLISMMSCVSEPGKDLEMQINALEKQLYEQQNGVINKKDAANIIHLYTTFVNENPENEKAPEYLFKAADVSINTFHSEQTIKLFNQLIKDYPNFEKAPQALFLKAFTYENYLNQMDSAKVSYELFLKKYPKHSFANDAEVSLNNLGKSPEEIINALKQGNP